MVAPDMLFTGTDGRQPRRPRREKLLNRRAAVIICIGAIYIATGRRGGTEAGAEAAPIFSKLALDDALASVKGNGKAVVADFTAAWCEPCKVMDRTSWRDPRVLEWMKTNAVAVRIDVDASREVARAQHILAMPTILVFRNGDVVERQVGAISADDLLAMLQRIQTAKPMGNGAG
jgi:thioredoxin 1